jgi:polyphenol oxidase
MSVPIETITNESLTEKGFYWRESGEIKVLICKPLEEIGFANGFSTRLGGVSPLPKDSLNLSGFDFDSSDNIQENRRRFLSTFDGDYQLSTVWQIHSDLIKTVNSKNMEETEDKYDGLISNLKSILIGVKTADCVPLLIGDPKIKTFAAIHAGWRGTVQSIVAKGIKRMTNEFGSEPKDLICAIGPAAIECYEVGKDVIEEFSANFGQSDHLFTPTKENHAFVDLHQANREQLLTCGVKESNIFTAPYCTMKRNDLFFSYREDRKSFEQTGRLLSVIGNA